MTARKKGKRSIRDRLAALVEYEIGLFPEDFTESDPLGSWLADDEMLQSDLGENIADEFGLELAVDEPIFHKKDLTFEELLAWVTQKLKPH
jgi:hypothetical protein